MLPFQVFRKFHICLNEVVNGTVVGDGRANFTKALKISIENKMRNTKYSHPTNTRKLAVRGQGIIGVLHDQYEPAIDAPSKERQVMIKGHMQNMHGLGPDTWTWEQIERDLDETYELQRQDIIFAKEQVAKLLNDKGEDSEHEQEADDIRVSIPALEQLKGLWPFLFKIAGLRNHHKRLTGRDIRPHLEEFLQNHLDLFLLFLTSSSSSNTINLALRIKLESNGKFETLSQMLLAMLHMLANHFKENIKLFLQTAEVR